MIQHVNFEISPRKSTAWLSTVPETNVCVIFVHGFMGSSSSTWEFFHELGGRKGFPGDWFYPSSDIYFFDYPSVSDFVSYSANSLDSFIASIFPRPEMSLFRLMPDVRPRIRDPWLDYKKLVLVGHSLGGVVIRTCIANQFSNTPSEPQATWVPAAEVRLFAPAHLGFHPNGVGKLAMMLLPDLLTRFLEIKRAFVDLQPRRGVLERLKDQTERLAIEHRSLTCCRAIVAFGRKEELVVADKFECDYKIKWFAESDGLSGFNHTQVCKPNENFVAPLEFVSYRAFEKPAGT